MIDTDDTATGLLRDCFHLFATCFISLAGLPTFEIKMKNTFSYPTLGGYGLKASKSTKKNSLCANCTNVGLYLWVL